MRRLLAILLALVLLPPAPAVRAEALDSVVAVELRPGWRLTDGSHMAAIEVRLAPGWKTYWRSPGDAGIPPLFDWDVASGNLRSVHVHFPAPQVFWQSGMRAVGYTTSVVFPLRIALREGAGDAQLGGTIELGVCKDICIPHRVRVSAALRAGDTRPDPVIAAALASAPLSAADVGIGAARCRIGPMEGGMRLMAELAVPNPGGPVETVIETTDPDIWVAEPESRWHADRLLAETRLRHRHGGAFAVDRSGVRITILRPGQAVDVIGCTG
jgi:hypothetical protein